MQAVCRGFFRPLGLALLFMIAFSSLLLAQTSTSIISGTITDSSGAIVAGAKVVVKNVGTGIAVDVTTDAQGRFRASELIIGDYEVQASQSGFQTVVRKGITTTVGGQAVVDITLPVGQAQQVVTVDAQVSLVDTTTSAIGNTVVRTQVQELPLGARNQTQLLALAPGVATSPAVGGANYGRQENYSVSGSRANGIQFLIDNTNLATYNGHSMGSAATGATLGMEAIADFQALTNTYSAQFGGNGGVVNAASKSGTNNLHGSAYGYLTNSGALQARSTFDTLVNPGETIAKAPPSRRAIFGGSIGGPVIKDKAFFFVNYEGVRQGGSSTAVYTNIPDANAHQGLLPCQAAPTVTCNTATGLANVGLGVKIAPIMALMPVGATTTTAASPLVGVTGLGNYSSVNPSASHNNYLLTRADYTFSGKDSLFVRYVRDIAYATTLVPNGGTLPLMQELDTTTNHFATIEERHIISPSLVNLARVSFLRPYEDAKTVGDRLPALEAVNTPGTTANRIAILNNTIGPSNLVPYRMAEQTYQAMNDVIWTHGSHNVKFGATFNVIADYTNQNNSGAAWTFPNILSFLTAAPSQLQGALPGKLDNFRDARWWQFMPYINDEWKVNRRLTVNLGVRYDWASNATERNNKLANVTDPLHNTNFVPVPNVMPNNPTNKNFAPRVGFAYDPFPDHKTSIRGGFGTFYNVMTAHIWLNSYWTTGPYVTATVVNPSWPVPFSGGTTNAVPSANQFGLSYVDRLSTPYMMQYNLSIQREVASGTIVSIAYVGSRGVHLIGTKDYNYPLLVNGVYGTAGPNGTTTPNPRPNLNFSNLHLRSNWGSSNYNSLQTSVNRRMANNFLAQVSYTYSKSIDYGSADQGPDSIGGNQVAMDPFHTNMERGRSSFDYTHVLKLNGIYELPFGNNQLVKGWKLSGVYTLQSGPPFTVFTGFDRTGAGGPNNSNYRPNLAPGATGNPIIGQKDLWFDPTVFTLQAIGTYGNLGRSTAVGPGLQNVNFALLKQTSVPRISELFKVEFRAEVNNLANHPNYALPTATIFTSGTGTNGARNAAAGKITGTVGGSRSVQFALRVSF